TFPTSLDQYPRPRLDGQGLPDNTRFDVNYSEGAAVGYKWFDVRRQEPLYPFGYGLSYTHFAHSELAAALNGEDLNVTFTVRNTGERAGADVAQIYMSSLAGGWEAPRRLGGFKKVSLQAGQATPVTLTIDPRLLATYDVSAHAWKIAAGRYRIALASSSRDPGVTVEVTLPTRTLAP
ncbi:MAG: fibronectin type III-like domain-contianing protein, partial [Pseudomonadota bacterium]